jgi:hypothetical protein
MIITTKTDQRNDQIKNYWNRFHAEKQAIYKKQIIQGCFIAVGLFLFPFIVLLLMTGKVYAAALTDVKFGRYQIADSQWNVNACLNTTTCQIYSKNPGTAYKIPWTSGQVQWAAGDYVKFDLSGNGSFPYTAKQYTSAGVLKSTLGNGKIVNMGPDYFFFVGSDNDTGQLFSGSSGMANTSSVTWTGTRNPTIAQADNYANATYSTEPLAAGQTAAPVVTVTGTAVTYTTRNVVSGNTTTVYRTPVTTTTYSDGTSTSTNGTEALYQTRVASTVVTNKVVGTTLTTYTTPINKVTTGGVTTIESNGAVVTTTQTVQQGLTYQVWRYDYRNYSCTIFGCIAIPFSYRTPSTNINDYGNTVRNGVTSGGMYLQTNARLPNGDGGLFTYNDGTVIRYTGTITAPITTARPAGTVYRLYFYNQTDDGFVLRINGGTIINNSQTDQWQAIGGNYNSNGWMDVVAGQSYNLEAWYWNVLGGVGHRFFWDYGDGIKMVPNSAFTTGVISAATIDTTGSVYSNSSVVDISGTTVLFGPTIEGGTIDLQNGTGTETITSGGSSSAGPTTEQQTRYNTWNNGTQSVNNYLYIEQVGGDYNTVNITQSGTKNTMDIGINGSSNTINATQTGINYLNTLVQGSANSVTSLQTNTSGTHYQETKIMSGNNNTINAIQKDNGNSLMFNTITGSNNSISAVQEGAGNHYLENKLTGNGNSVLANQSGSTANKANIDLTNAGGPANVDLQQSGGKSFTIIQSCTNPAGCSTVIRQ